MLPILLSGRKPQLGPITILVNNAGIGLFGPAHEKTEADWDRVLDTNLKSVFLLSRAVAPAMIRRGSGDIINISSLAGKNTFAGGGIYCASKWGVLGLSGCMAEDLREHGIRVSVIVRGSVATDFSGRGAKDGFESAKPGRCCPRRGSHRHAGPAQLPQRDSPAAVAETIVQRPRPGWIFLLTIIVITTMLKP